MTQILVVGLGGLIGACARFGITKIFEHWLSFSQLGTLVSNVLAGLLIGFIIGFERNTTLMSNHAKLFFETGILGGLSTFSTFSIETVAYIEDAQYIKALMNVLLNVSLSIAFVFIGFMLANIFRSKFN